MRTALAVIALVVSAFTIAPAPPADAACSPNVTSCAGWWKVQSSTAGDFEYQYTYGDYALNCLPSTTTGKAIQVIVAVPTGKASNNAVTNYLPSFRELFRRIASVYGASTERVYGAGGKPRTEDYSPRFVTRGDCDVLAYYEEFPQATLDAFPGTTGGIYDQLRARGYTATNRKYVVVHLSDGFPSDGGPHGTFGWGGGVTSGDPNPVTNPNNQGGARTDFMSMYIGQPSGDGAGLWTPYRMSQDIYTGAHELVHQLGGVAPGAPHYNDLHIYGNGGDVMAYGYNYDESCLSGARGFIRLDCGHDDYFNIGTGSLSWAWWAISRSDYLWKGQA